MGTECITATLKEDADGMPSIPPGFGPFAGLALRGIQSDTKIPECQSSPVLALQVPSATNSPECQSGSVPSQGCAPCSTSESETYRKSLRHRPSVDYSRFDNSSDEEADFELAGKGARSVGRLPKGVLRGCSECRDCQKVIARWTPDGACRPVLDDAPAFYPTEEEFKDTLKYIESIRPVAESYGICRIVPPSSWRPPCPLKETTIWESSKFATRVQKVDKLQNRKSAKKNVRERMMRKRRKLSETEEKNNVGLQQNCERFGFEPGPDFTLEAFQKYADDFSNQYFRKDISLNSQPSVEDIEGEYWRIVERPTEEIEVIYGADLETGAFGSGFPKSSADEKSEAEDQYTTSGWNLNNLPRLQGSVLSFEGGDISGVLVPWLYVGMCFSSFCWHVEDHHLYSLNYMHWGAPKMWYGVPGKDAVKLEAAMKKHLPDLFEEQPDLLHNLVTQFSPSLLKSEDVPVYRCVQHEGEFVLTFPRAYHAGFNCGFNCAEAVNVAPIDWLPIGQNAVELYRQQARKITISHDKLLLGAAKEAIKAQWEILFLKRNSAENLRWKNICGPDSLLSKALKARIEVELAQRGNLSSSSKSDKMGSDFDATDRECAICFFDLHLSASGCSCCPEKFACLVHAEHLCSCDWSARFFLFRYDIDQLNLLADALGGKLSAVYRCGLNHLGLSLSSCVKKEKAQDVKTIRRSTDGTRRSYSSQASTVSLVLPSDVQKDNENKVLNSDSPQTNVTSYSAQRMQLGNISPSEEHSVRNERLSQTNVTSYSAQRMQLGNISPLKETSVRNEQLCNREGAPTSQHSGGSGGQKNSMLSFSGSFGQSSSSTVTSASISSIESIPGMHNLAVFKGGKELSSGTGENRSSLAEHHNRSRTLINEETKVKPTLESSNAPLRLMACDSNATLCHSYKDQELAIPKTNASVMSEKDTYHVPPPLNQQLVRTVPQSASQETSSVSPLKPLADTSMVKEPSVSASANPVRPAVGNGRPNGEWTKRKPEPVSDCQVRARGDLVVPRQPAVDIHNRHGGVQKGPRIANVVHRFKCSVEPLEYGVVLSGKLWSSNQAIFPKGFRSRVQYLSIVDPTKMVYYVSEILDAGLHGPLFMVTLENCASEVFAHVSPTRCWNMVRERLNMEIRRQHGMGRANLPTLQPPGSIDGLEMFGLLSPAIIQAIEARDNNRICTEYWRSRPRPPAAVEHGGNEQHASPPRSPHIALRGLFQRANEEELQALRSLLTNNNDTPDNSRQQVAHLLDEEVAKRRC